MSDQSTIEWTDATLFGPPLPRRCRGCGRTLPIEAFSVDQSRPDGHGYVCRRCRRVSPEGVPNRVERAQARLQGRAWCCDCAAWHPVSEVTKQGLCREHQRASDRTLYARDLKHRQRRRDHVARHKRGVSAVPLIGVEALTELFDGVCAYCPAQADTWDHVVPVSKGGITEPGNVLPACRSCNSSKRDRDLDEWLTATGREMSVPAVEHLSLHGALHG
ncbi:MAG TPA: HNH endonuclease [Amaricoccus sp.]|uniref:HNH endonuclease n=1 Tax=Amaricoccus sp. TaxID=1872485 RepID=UPI002BBE1DA1|nr:HNH endonuclease [Amaricoccus sp.]HMR51235.1 HNH endonuclease [Amaricoccus sp.]HMT98016.1 HNH endonuclease [Amaricoccus sp.]